jgi:hypothetical protein
VTELIKEKNKTKYPEGAFEAVEKFINWLKSNGYYSYDQYDFWSTGYGIKSKAIYYKTKIAGIPFVAPIFLAEIFYPKIRKSLVERKRFPIADAHFILGFLNLFEVTSDAKYLDEAKKVATDLLKTSVPGFSGYCWGYPFDWMTTRGLWTSGIPLITTTGYCYEAFIKLFKITNQNEYLDIAYSIFTFTLKDLKDTPIEKGISSGSYSPIDNSQIVNANAYRSYVLIDGAKRFNNDEALQKATLNINFILKNQNEDGSWKYAINDERDNFVDHFHTCFVLKNLYKLNQVLNEERIDDVIKKGFDFYKKNLFDKTGSPKPFAKLSRVNIVKRELYDYAEGISLCLLMESSDKEAGKLAEHMVQEVIHLYQNKNGSFVTNVNLFNIENKIPYLRWAQAQLFFALTNYLKN